MDDLSLTYFGVLRAVTSWAKVSRELLRALIELGVDINIYERKGFLYDAGFCLPLEIEERIGQTFRQDVVFTFEHPNTYTYLLGQCKVGLLTYESTVVPSHWVENIERFLDLLILPSRYTREIFTRSGVCPDRIAVIPYGYRPDIYNRYAAALKLDTEKRFRFLTVSSPHKREGLEVLLQAYAQAFNAQDDVSLIIKVNYLPPLKTKPFEYRDLRGLIDTFKANKGNPEVVLIYTVLSEKEMAGLYKSCSCLVSATRGEGFGMAFLEAQACGLPVIVTGWGGHLDFLNTDNAMLVNYKLRPAREIQYDCQDTNAQVAEPDVFDMADKMRKAYLDQLSARDQVREKSDYLHQYTWKNLATRFIEQIQKRS